VITLLVSVLLVSGASAVLTAWVRRNALSRGVIDYPNRRSSHSQPTPRGGGISIVITTAIALVVLWYRGLIDTALLLALQLGGVAVAAVGYADDRGSVAVRVRLAVHLASAICAVYVLGGFPAVQIGAAVFHLGMVGNVCGVLAIVWVLNLFNFMDGIDGIAATESVFIVTAGAVLCSLAGSSSSVMVAAPILAAAIMGFLIWNWPPAKIFMGDVGSGYLGYMIAVLAIGAARENGVALFVWLILGGIFFVDATLTLFRRLARGEKIYEAHRSHAYQWLARRWQSHRRVTLTVIAVNVCWLLPAAGLALRFPHWAAECTVAALLPIALLAMAAGAGRAES
jgi:Fuc2NAc and GlcNAc transferase